MNAPGWFARGRELMVFGDDAEQARYLMAFRRGDAGGAAAMLEAAMAGGNARMPAANWLAFSAEVERIERSTQDGPGKLIEDWSPQDFLVEPWSGGVGCSASLVAGGSGWGLLMCDLCSDFLSRPRAEREGYARRLQDAALGAGRAPAGLGALARAATAAAFLAAAGPGSPVLAAAAPYWGQAASLAPSLRSRAQAVASLWEEVVGSPAAPFLPLTLHALRSCSTVAGIAELLTGASAPGNENLVQYLCCQDYNPS